MHSLFRVKDSRKTEAAQAAAPGSSVTRYVNCRLLIGHELRTGQDLWVRDGSVADPKQLFWEGRSADTTIDCQGRILAPGFIDLQVLAHAPASALPRPCCQALRSDARRRASGCSSLRRSSVPQLNGGFGADFCMPEPGLEAGLRLCARRLVEFGVTAFLPTVNTTAGRRRSELHAGRCGRGEKAPAGWRRSEHLRSRGEGNGWVAP